MTYANFTERAIPPPRKNARMTKQCPTHKIDLVPTKSRTQLLCPNYECDYFVATKPPAKAVPKDEKTRQQLIADAVAAKAKATTAPAGEGKPVKMPPVKIPAKLNATTGVSKKDAARANKQKADQTDTVTDKAPLVASNKRTKIPVIPEDMVEEIATLAKDEADAELDANVKPKKKVKDPDELTVSDVAREVGIEPKVARQRLRKDGTRAPDGRWPTVRRNSPEHAALRKTLAGETSTKGAEADDEGEEE